MPQNKFVHFPNRPAKLTAEFAKDEYQKLLDRIANAEKSKTSDRWLKLFADWNELKSYIDSEGSRTRYAYNRHMDNQELEAADEYYRKKIAPIARDMEHKMMLAYLDSKYMQIMSKSFGGQLAVIYKTALKPLDPTNTKLRIRESKLESTYDKLKASAQVIFHGEKMTLSEVGSFIISPNEALRKKAWLVGRDWFYKNRDELAAIYDKLVGLRHQMAVNLGFQSYTELGYQERGRSDYGRPEVEAFRDHVRKYVVPLLRAASEEQASILNKKELRPWDGYDPRTTLPLGIIPVNQQLDKAQKLFNNLSPELGSYFNGLHSKGLIDLENRPSKETNPYCTSFSDSNEVAILCNSTGNSYDISNLVHECGHAFQWLQSISIEPVDLQWGTYDLAEIPSMSMEYLSLSRIDLFFSKENAEKYRRKQVEGFIGTLCYVCLVDEFQHWVYDNPTASLNQRDEKWEELSQTYLAPVDYGGYEQYRNLRWYAQSHIFTAPFYYIDYALAETAAMQIAMIDAKDHKKAMDIYMELCRLGGTKSFLAALKHVGLRSPFDESLIKDLSDHTAEILKINR